MNPDLILLALSLFTWGIGEGMFFYFQPIYLAQLGANPLMIGAILGGAGLAMTLVHIPAGYLSDKIGRRPMMRAAWLVGMLSTWMMALVRSLPFFVIGLILYSLTAFVASPLNSYVTAARGKLSVGRALTLISATFNLGVVLGPIAGGWLGDRFGMRTIFTIAGCIFILSNILIFFLRSQPRDDHDPDAPPLRLFANWRYLAFLGIAFVVLFALYLPQPLTPVFLKDIRGLSLSQIGILGSIGGLGNALINLVLGHFDARRGFLLGQIAVGAFTLLIWRGEGLLAFGLGYFLLGGYRAARPLAAAQVRSLVHQAQMGLAYGLTETIGALPVVLAPPLAGYLYERDPVMIYPFSLAVIAAALILSIAFAPRQTAGVQVQSIRGSPPIP